jgi:NAD(P)-dependent dehydrogenase (short-subunit alcohol dehydrogenase family)
MYREKFDLSGKLALVTGGGRNIGLACAHALAEAGAKVVITGRATSDTSIQGQARLAELGYDVGLIRFDVRKPDEVDAAADAVLGEYGAPDILVCNPGNPLRQVPAEEVDDDLWLEQVDITLNSAFWTCRAFGKHMLARGSGSIVNIGSMSGTIVNKPLPQCHFNTAKAGMHHLTRCLAAEWADRGVRVNCVAPTYIEKPEGIGKRNPEVLSVWMEMTPMHRQGLCEEVAPAVLFLASDAASLITGQIIHTDAGYTLW